MKDQSGTEMTFDTRQQALAIADLLMTQKQRAEVAAMLAAGDEKNSEPLI